MRVIFLEIFSLNTFSGLDILYGLKNMCGLNFDNSTQILSRKNENSDCFVIVNLPENLGL
jgi:hypothetical protein